MLMNKALGWETLCLNPYFNGIYFLMLMNKALGWETLCLNPYFNGIYFLITVNLPAVIKTQVS